MKLRENVGVKENWEKIWKLNQEDPYSKACIEYTKFWGELMDNEMENGAKLEDIAQEMSFQAAKESGITIAMYNMAVNILVRHWLYGKELLKWHNRRWAHSNEEGDKLTEESRLINSSIAEIGD